MNIPGSVHVGHIVCGSNGGSASNAGGHGGAGQTYAPKIFTDSTILVTGGTGSMGKTFVKRALAGEFGHPSKVVVFSRDEAKQYDMQRTHPKAHFIIGDVRNYADVYEAMLGVNWVVHAAALKQVPSSEYAPLQTVLTNCLGMDNVIRAARARHVSAVVAVSTDKACKPTTVMGMTKALQERMLVAANVGNSRTRFVGVRYGNVLASRGSVIPLFQDQIRTGGPITVTDVNMTRFLLTLDEAVDAMMEALKYGRPGEIYVPGAAPAANMMDLALELAHGRDIKIEVTGIRPNEKLHEIMVSAEEAGHTRLRGSYYVIEPMLQELRRIGSSDTIGEEYSSADAVLTPYKLRTLLMANGLWETV